MSTVQHISSQIKLAGKKVVGNLISLNTVAEQIKHVGSLLSTADILLKRKKVSEIPHKIPTAHKHLAL